MFLVLSGDAQLPFADLDVDVLVLDPGQLCFDHVSVVRLLQVDQG
jgi:hypothetical protein